MVVTFNSGIALVEEEMKSVTTIWLGILLMCVGFFFIGWSVHEAYGTHNPEIIDFDILYPKNIAPAEDTALGFGSL